MSNKQDTIQQICVWIEEIHKTQDDLYRYIHREDDWRYQNINGHLIYCGDNEYPKRLHCYMCGAITEVYVKKGKAIGCLLKDIECQGCGIKFATEADLCNSDEVVK